MAGKRLVWKPGTMLYPLPAVLVSCGTLERPNAMTAAWAGTICSDPSMCYVSIRRSRYSHGLILESGCYVVNLVTEGLCRAADFCGVRSGRDFDKFAAAGLSPLPASRVSAPMIASSPLNIECRVRKVVELGSHDMFMAEVEAVDVDESLVDKNGSLRLDRCPLVAYSHGEYRLLGKKLGTFGFSVRKKRR